MNINNYGQDKKVYIPDEIKAILAIKENAGQGFNSKTLNHEK